VDTFVGMRVFAKVVETESFAEAARRLKLSPAMVTKHIQGLEQRVGTRLLNRTSRRFSLTEAGAIYHQRCVTLLADLDNAEHAVGNLGRMPRGRLRVTAGADFGGDELWPIARAFMQKYPEISIDLILTDRMVDLVGEEVDLAIRMVERDLDPSLVARKLAVSRLVLCASPEYLRTAGVPKTPDDLASHRCLLHGDRFRHDGWVLRRNGCTRRVRVAGRIQSNRGSVLRDAAVDSLGIAMLPTFDIWRQLAAGCVRAVLPDWDAGALGIFVVFPSRKFMPAKTRLFIDFLAERFDRGPDHDVWFARAQPRGPGAARNGQKRAESPSARRPERGRSPAQRASG
jgi:DNA-binding transcriptional LysR family regulator